MDKLREEFEQWWNNKMAMCFYSQPKSQKETIYHASWLAWQASRASIVVDIPNDLRIETIVDKKVQQAFVNGHLLGRKGCSDAIRSIGLSIKGE
ncbi:hypothetical protein L7815_010885 [Serratia marcescens]|uniref:hypothetical protein n=1 Tax=Serratia marcescens TaxID=615 RepID=UPI001EE730E6|nr:hypothetical protein [Serratia marcescens]MCG5374439.1 hypothetical protein [Serratia marcescens]